MFRFLLGFCAGVAVGLNCPKVARRGSQVLRDLADRLDRAAAESERFHMAEEHFQVVR